MSTKVESNSRKSKVILYKKYSTIEAKNKGQFGQTIGDYNNYVDNKRKLHGSK